MASLKAQEKLYFETLFGMSSGYVLDFSDATFAEFFSQTVKIDIHSEKYETYGTSKAKKMRAFWEQENDQLVSQVLAEMLDLYEANCELGNTPPREANLKKCRSILTRMQGQDGQSLINTADDFLKQKFANVSFEKLPIEHPVREILEARLVEAQVCIKEGVPLAAILLCGSILEGALLGAAQQRPRDFNQSKCAPRDKDNKVKPFQDWSLSSFIDVACDIDAMKLDVKKFSHSLRDFRSYIHPYEQLASKFSPDPHTAEICLQVLKAAIADLSKKR